MMADSDVQCNYNIVGCLAEWCECTHRFAGNSSFCQAHAFEVLTPTSTYRQLIICIFYLSKDFVIKIIYPAILFTTLMGFFWILKSFIFHAFLPETSLVFTIYQFFCQAHDNMEFTQWFTIWNISLCLDRGERTVLNLKILTECHPSYKTKPF